MSSFPLYNTLINDKNIPNSITTKQQLEFIKKIKKVDVTGRELIYALIKNHHLLSERKNTCFISPYKGIKKKKSISFNLLNLPDKLQSILYFFIIKHLQEIKKKKKRTVSKNIS